MSTTTQDQSRLSAELAQPSVVSVIDEMKIRFVTQVADTSRFIPIIRHYTDDKLMAEISLRSPTDPEDAISCVTEAGSLGLFLEADRIFFSYDSQVTVDGAEDRALVTAVISRRGIAAVISLYDRSGDTITWQQKKNHRDDDAALDQAVEVIDMDQAFTLMKFARSDTHSHRKTDVDLFMATLAKRGHEITYFGNNPS